MEFCIVNSTHRSDFSFFFLFSVLVLFHQLYIFSHHQQHCCVNKTKLQNKKLNKTLVYSFFSGFNMCECVFLLVLYIFFQSLIKNTNLVIYIIFSNHFEFIDDDWKKFDDNEILIHHDRINSATENFIVTIDKKCFSYQQRKKYSKNQK